MLGLVELPADERPASRPGVDNKKLQFFAEGGVVNSKVGTLKNRCHFFKAINLRVIVGITDLLSEGRLIPDEVLSQGDLGGCLETTCNNLTRT
jgi:hypothetical protein